MSVRFVWKSSLSCGSLKPENVKHRSGISFNCHLTCFGETRLHHWVIMAHMTRITRKQTLRSLSLSYQKKDGRVWPRPSFFWCATDFYGIWSMKSKDSNSKKSVSYQKKDGRDKDLKICFLVTHLTWWASFSHLSHLSSQLQHDISVITQGWMAFSGKCESQLTNICWECILAELYNNDSQCMVYFSECTVPCEKIEPLFFLHYSANMYSRKTILHTRLWNYLCELFKNVAQVNRNTLLKVSVLYDEYSASYSRKTGGPIFRRQL